MPEAPGRSGPLLLGTSATQVKIAGGAGTWAICRSILLCNTHTGTVKVTMVVHNAVADVQAKRIASGLSLASGQTEELISPGNWLVLLGGGSPDIIVGFADVASVVTATVSSWELV